MKLKKRKRNQSKKKKEFRQIWEKNYKKGYEFDWVSISKQAKSFELYSSFLRKISHKVLHVCRVFKLRKGNQGKKTKENWLNTTDWLNTTEDRSISQYMFWSREYTLQELIFHYQDWWLHSFEESSLLSIQT